MLIISGSMLVSVPPARANDFWSSVGGSVVGTVVGNAISDRVAQPQPKRVYVERAPAKPAISSAQRAQNARVQTALNYFGFPAGAPDGVIGRGTRAAAANYQAYMGYPASGYLADYEIGTLLGAYDWALMGGPAVNQALASGQGGRGLLVAYRQQMVGAPAAPPVVVPAAASVPAAAPVSTPVPAATPVPVAAPVPAAAPEQVAAGTAPVAVPPAPGPSGLPVFIAGAKVAASMNAVCARVAVETDAEGGPVKVSADGGTPIDIDQMLSEQFCLARGYAMSQGESLAATAQGFTSAQIEAQCLAFAPTMADYVARLTRASVDDLAKDLRAFVAGSGVPAEQLSANARICLGAGYRLDNPDLSLASALVLVGLNDDAYAELVGHQMRLGLGTPARPSYGLDWIDYAVEALDGGATPLVSQGNDERLALLEVAVLSDALDKMPRAVPAAGTAPAPAEAEEQARMLLPGAPVSAPASAPAPGSN